MVNSDLTVNRQIAANVRAHDRLARKYDALHGEIFNDIEQSRIQSILAEARGLLPTSSKVPRALDFGCGSGNISRHLLALEFDVTAADVSQGFLDLVRDRYPSPRLQTMFIEGGSTSLIPNDYFDLVAVYSVLHHIPDYLHACREFARVCKPGGVVVIDHEHTENFWHGDPLYSEFRARALKFNWRKYFTPMNYIHRIIRIFKPRHSNEGDIHVWPDDHVEWEHIRKTMNTLGLDAVVEKEYLLNHSLYRPEVYRAYVGRCTDMKAMIFRKKWLGKTEQVR